MNFRGVVRSYLVQGVIRICIPPAALPQRRFSYTPAHKSWLTVLGRLARTGFYLMRRRALCRRFVVHRVNSAISARTGLTYLGSHHFLPAVPAAN